jgi:hypothetical protein
MEHMTTFNFFDWILSKIGKLQESTVFQSLFENLSARHLSDLKLGYSAPRGGL